jgi:hypothetical protein
MGTIQSFISNPAPLSSLHPKTQPLPLPCDAMGFLPTTTGNWSNSPSGAANPAIVPATNGANFYRLKTP